MEGKVLYIVYHWPYDLIMEPSWLIVTAYFSSVSVSGFKALCYLQWSCMIFKIRSLIYSPWPASLKLKSLLNSQNLIVNSPHKLLLISLLISHKHLLLDEDDKFEYSHNLFAG